LIVLTWRSDFSVFKTVGADPWKYKVYVLSALLLAVNWGVWIWSVTHGHVVDASLGYFINPLLNVAIGVLFLREHLRRMQWVSLFLAGAGVLYLTTNYGQFPWIALTLAGSFALYGYIRKTAALGAVNGLAIEVSVLIVPAIALLLYLDQTTILVLRSTDFSIHAWLSVTGLITVVPLTMFAYGARKIPYSTLGFIQYIAPTLQFLIGIYLYNEDFSLEKLIGFGFIWLALIVYSSENIYFHKHKSLLISS
jgi:chloramphenicol-sensitive protein RarD